MNSRRLSPAGLTPEQRREYDRMKAKAVATRHLLGPPLPDQFLTPEERENAAPFYFELRAFTKQLKDAREAAGLTLAQVAEKTGLAEETLCRLESGAVTNPTWKTLGLYAVAVGHTINVTATPLPPKPKRAAR